MSSPLITVYFDKVVIDEDYYNALLLDFGSDEGNVWIPRSLIHQLDETKGEMEIPVWFAEKEGLI